MRRIREREIELCEVLKGFDYATMLTALKEHDFTVFPLADLEQLRNNLASLVDALNYICERKRQSEIGKYH